MASQEGSYKGQTQVIEAQQPSRPASLGRLGWQRLWCLYCQLNIMGGMHNVLDRWLPQAHQGETASILKMPPTLALDKPDPQYIPPRMAEHIMLCSRQVFQPGASHPDRRSGLNNFSVRIPTKLNPFQKP